ncbi:UNVERIFIED_CONTAM: hypothetical protein NCL1_09461 [Trichonephila clavipes]
MKRMTLARKNFKKKLQQTYIEIIVGVIWGLFENRKPENAVHVFKGSGVYPLNRKAIQHQILITDKGNNPEHIPLRIQRESEKEYRARLERFELTKMFWKGWLLKKVTIRTNSIKAFSSFYLYFPPPDPMQHFTNSNKSTLFTLAFLLIIYLKEYFPH